MAFKVTWKPVLQTLALSDYHAEYADNVIMVCVNPTPEFLQERVALMADYSRKLVEAQAATQKAEQDDVDAKVQAFSEWSENVFMPGMQAWFARLWSFGADKWTVDDLNDIDSTDPHLLAWLKARSMEMVEVHRVGRKKA